MLSLINRTTLASALVAASAKAHAQSGGLTEGGKLQLGVNALTLSEEPIDNINYCISSSDLKNGNINYLANEVKIVINPFENLTSQLSFVVSDILAYEQDKTLLLVYSTGLVPIAEGGEGQILTPKSKHKLELNLDAGLEIIGIYNIPANKLVQLFPTRIGQGNPALRTKVGFSVNLDNTVIPAMMDSGEGTIYLQAALLPSKDFEAGIFNNMILSEVDTVHFVANECPRDMTMFNPTTPSVGEVATK